MQDDDQINLPELGQHALNGQLGEAEIESAVLKLGHLYTRNSGLDFGIDGVIEIVSGNERKMASGRQIGVQVKRGLSVLKKTRFGRTLYCTQKHANYWLDHSLPIIVVHRDPESDRLRWRKVDRAALRKTKHGFAIDLPEDSDLLTSFDELISLGSNETAIELATQAFTITYDPENGVTASDDALGTAALEFTRATLRGAQRQVDVEFIGEADLVASIDAVRDIPNPSQEQRRKAVSLEDLLHYNRQHAKRLNSVLTLLLSNEQMAHTFAYQHLWLAKAIKEAAPPLSLNQWRPGDQKLDAWPGPQTINPIVRFFVPIEVLEEYYAQNKSNKVLIQMGASGGVMVLDFPMEVIATRYFPALANRIFDYALENGMGADEALKSIGVQPEFWLVGIS